MTREDIIKGNRIIAEFINARYFPASREYELYGIIECIQDGENEQHFFTPGQMKFNTSWDWLMPVVEKIEGIDNSDGYEVDIFGRCCDIGGVIETVAKNKIEATFIAVVKFIAKANGKEWILD